MSSRQKAHSLYRFVLSVITHRVFLWAVLVALFTVVTYWRNPTYLTVPNFYAEDGTVFAQNIITHGFLQSLITPFNGYFIVGLYLLEGMAFAVNMVVGGGNILNLPAAVAGVSYLFWALVCGMPFLLFWREIPRRYWLVLICVALLLLPLPSFGYAVLGTIGNYKFAFLFIAFLLLLKRHWLPRGSRWFYVIDVALIVCAFTNATTYLLLPFAALRYLPERRQWNKTFFAKLLRDRSFISLAIVAAAAGAQVLFVLAQGGVAELKGYLDQPFEYAKTIEIFVQRTLLYPFTHIAEGLNDVIIVLIGGGLVAGLHFIARREDRVVLYFGLFASLSSTLLFVTQRPGVSQFFNAYSTSGTDHFFYPQNWIFLFTVLFVVVRAAHIARLRWRIGATLFLLIVALSMVLHNKFGHIAADERGVGTLWQHAAQQCAAPHNGVLQLPVYPAGAGITMAVSDSVCTPEVAQYIPPRITLPLAPHNNNYVAIPTARLTQTFTATYDQLSGVSVYLSTFGIQGGSVYRLDLLDATCHNNVRSSTFVADTVKDNLYHDIRFSPVTNSKNMTYCFVITPVTLQPGTPPLALQLSAPDRYTEGVATRDNKPLAEDIVFDVLYR